MSENELVLKVRELREYQRIAEEATAAAELLKNDIKTYMGDNTQLIAGEYKITWKAVDSARIDTAALKKALPEIAERFTKLSTTRRFLIVYPPKSHLDN